MRESEVEKQFVAAVKAAGGQALKFTSQTMNGVPDRLVLLIGGKCAFVELKAPGKQMRILQRKRRQQLEALGFPVFCVDRLEQIQPAVDALLCWTPGEPLPQPRTVFLLHFLSYGCLSLSTIPEVFFLCRVILRSKPEVTTL